MQKLCFFGLLGILCLATCVLSDICTQPEGDEDAWAFIEERVADPHCEIIELQEEWHIIYQHSITRSLEISRTLEIRSPGVTIYAPNTHFPLFYVDGSAGNDVKFTLSGFTLNGINLMNIGGSIRVDDASIHIMDCSFLNNEANQGAGLYILNSPSAIFEHVTFNGNMGHQGSSVYAENSVLNFTDCTFQSNSCHEDDLSLSSATVTLIGGHLNISDSHFEGNRAGKGADMYVREVDFISVTNVDFHHSEGGDQDQANCIYVSDSKKATFHQLGLYDVAEGKEHVYSIHIVASNISAAFTYPKHLFTSSYHYNLYLTSDQYNSSGFIVYHRGSDQHYEGEVYTRRFALIDELIDPDRKYCEYCKQYGICQPNFADCDEILEEYSDCEDLAVEANVPETVEYSLVCPENLGQGNFYTISSGNAQSLQTAINNAGHGEEIFICFVVESQIEIEFDSETLGSDAIINFYGGEGDGTTINLRGSQMVHGAPTLRFFNVHLTNCGESGCFSLNYPMNFLFYRSSIQANSGGESAIYLHGIQSSVEIRESLFKDIHTSGESSALYIASFHNHANPGTFQLVDTVFENCINIDGAGGAITFVEQWDEGDNIIFRNLSFIFCSAHNGGALNLQLHVGTPFRIESSSFVQCGVESGGGLGAAIYVHGDEEAAVELFDCRFISNQVGPPYGIDFDGDSGVIHIDNVLHISITRCQFWFNHFGDHFAAVYTNIENVGNVAFFGNVGNTWARPHYNNQFLFFETRKCIDYCLEAAQMTVGFDKNIDCASAAIYLSELSRAVSISSASGMAYSSSSAIIKSSASSIQESISSHSAASVSSSSYHQASFSSIMQFSSVSESIISVSSSSYHKASFSSIMEIPAVSESIISSSYHKASFSSIMEFSSVSESIISAASVSSSSYHKASFSSIMEIPAVSESIISAWSASSAAAFENQKSGNDGSSSNMAIIGGAVGGGLLLLILLAVVIVLVRRNRSLNQKVSGQSRNQQLVNNGFGPSLELAPRNASPPVESTYEYVSISNKLGVPGHYDVLKPSNNSYDTKDLTYANIDN